MTAYGDAMGKFFVGELAGAESRMLAGSVKLAYVHLTSPPKDVSEKTAKVLTLNHPAFESREDRFRRRREFNNFLAQNEAVLQSVHALLRSSGILCLRVSAYSAAYARLLGDEIFGDDAFVNEIPLRSPVAALLHGRFAVGPAHDDTVLVFARDPGEYQWYVGGSQAATRLQLTDLVTHATLLGDLVLTVAEAHPLGGVTSRAIALKRRVVVVHPDANLLRHLYASCAGNDSFPVWMGEPD
jgi:hypothetical protein